MNKNAAFRVYQASAGSGKTYTLVKEYLKLCLKSEANVAKFRTILAMTFTNAAANEMKQRIVSDLCDIIGSDEPKGIEADLMKELEISDDVLKQNAQRLLTCIMHDYSSFCVCTIDAFVQKIIRSFAHELGLSSQYAVSIDDKEMANAVVDKLGTKISEDNAFLAQIVADFCKNQFVNEHSDDLQKALLSFICKLMTEKAFQRDENNNIHNLEQYKETEKFLKEKMQGFEDKMNTCLMQFKAFEKQYDLTTSDYYYGGASFASYFKKIADKNYEDLGTRFLNAANQGAWYSNTAEKRFSQVELDSMTGELIPLLQSVIHLIENERAAYLFYSSQRDLLYLYALRIQIKDEFIKIAEDDEIVHISEFNKMINKVLGDYSVPFIYEKVGDKFRHVFVDEFQDTSLLQWQNLLPLIDDGLAANELSLVVGDGKQSIYRFRSGEVGQLVCLPEIYAMPDDERHEAFYQYQENLISHFDFSKLDTNRRSLKNIVLFNNDFFEKSCKLLSEEYQRVYIDQNKEYGKEVSVAQNTFKEKEGFVQVQLYDRNDVDLCYNTIENLIFDLIEKGYDYGDIAILTRKSNLGSSIANYLNGKNIPVVSRDSILLNSSNKVRLIVNTLDYLINNDNELVVANEIYLWHAVKDESFFGDLSGLFSQVKAIAKGNVALETILGIGEPGLLTTILAKTTCLYDFCASLERLFGFNALDDAFLAYFMDMVFERQCGIQDSITDFLDFWKQNKDKLSIGSASTNAVNIMTIHKSKGLQFPVVIYPDAITDLNYRLTSNLKPVEVWVSPEELGFEPIPNLEKVLFKLSKEAEKMGNVASNICQKERDDNMLDNLNILYVAFTRAMQRLYVLADSNKNDKDNKKENKDQCNIFKKYMDSTCLPDGMKVDEERVLLQFGNPDFQKIQNGDKKQQEVTKLSTHGNEVASCEWFNKIDVDSDPSMFWVSPDDKMSPSEWGNLVHEMLSKVENIDDIDRTLQPYIMEGVIDDEMAILLKNKIIQMINHPIIGRAFDKDAKVKNECEILIEGKVLRPDRYAELSDIIILLDYKTGKKNLEHHRQLREYIAALRAMVKKNIYAYLVYLAEPIEVEEVSML